MREGKCRPRSNPPSGSGKDTAALMSSGQLPGWRSVLAVVAHPDDESFGLGAILPAFADRNARLGVLCLTRGEASTLHGVAGELGDIRAGELAAAAKVLGVSAVELFGYPDGHLADTPPDKLAIPVIDFAERLGAQDLLVFDPTGVTGHPDHRQATAAAESPQPRWACPYWDGRCPPPWPALSTLSTPRRLSVIGSLTSI